MLLKKGSFFLGAMRNWKLSRPQLNRLQDRKFRVFLKEAYEHVPFYRARLDRLGLTPDDLRGVGDLQKIPTTTKADISSNFPAGIARTDIRTKVSRNSTGSGTSKIPTRVLWSEEQVDARDALLLRRFSKMGLRPWMRLASVWPPQSYWRKTPSEAGDHQPTTVLDEMPLAGYMRGGLPFIRTVEVGPGDLARAARRLGALLPDYIMGRASILRRLGPAPGMPDIRIRARGLICGTEFFTSAVGEELSALFSADVFRAYGGAEMGAVGGECSSHRGIHLFEDFMIVEILKDGDPARPGEVGEIVLTSLHNRLMPFIRYRTGDYARVADGGVCDCGSSFVRVESILGRASDAFIARGGKKIFPMEIAEQVESVVGLRDYQIIQTRADEITLKLPRESARDRKLARETVSVIEGVVGTQLRFAVEERSVEEIWNKNRPVVCLMAQMPDSSSLHR